MTLTASSMPRWPLVGLLLLSLAGGLLPQRPAAPRLAYHTHLAAPVKSGEALSLESRWVAVANQDEVRVLELATGKPVTVLPCAGARVCKFVKNRLLVGGREGVDYYETPSFKKLWRHNFVVETATASADGSLVVAAHNRPQEENLSVVMLSGQGSVLWAFNGKGMSLESLDAGSDGRHLIIHWNNPKDQFWLYNPWQRRFIVDGAGRGALHAGYLAQLAKGRLRVVDLDRGQLVGPVDCADKTLAFAPDGRRVLTGSRTWEATDLSPAGRFNPPGPGASRFFGDSDRVVSWQPNGQATVWDAGSGQPLTLAFEAVAQPAALAGQGQRLAAVGADHLKVWEW